MRKLIGRILTLGGIQSTNSYVKMNLSLFGLYPRAHVPTVPPQVVLLPGQVLYEMFSWTRAIVVPLAVHMNSQGASQMVGKGDPLARSRIFATIPWRAWLRL